MERGIWRSCVGVVAENELSLKHEGGEGGMVSKDYQYDRLGLGS